GEPVVLQHGLSGSHRWWRYTVPALAERFRVHVPEMVGFGASRGAVRRPTLPEMAGLLVQWLDAMDVERVHFVGHSMGAQLGVHLAARWPDRLRTLILTDAAGIPHPLSRAQIAEVAGDLVRLRSWGRLDFLPTIAADAVRAGPTTLYRAIRSILADDIRPLLPKVRAPTLLVWGEHDPITPVADGHAILERLPGARLVVIPDASHNVMADRPDAFNRTLLDFLEDHRQG
ncbi:MAG: alpha/beta fold hydrolase, partial [Gemmatimonadota bacterium]